MLSDRSSAETQKKYCIVGAGPSGLCMAAELKRRNVEFEILERYSDKGGIWQIENPESPMYETAHFISSRTQGAFEDFPMPESYPDYPSHRQILEYLLAFSAHHELGPFIRYGQEVERVVPGPDGADVSVNGEQRRYRGVVCATGTNWDPVVPKIPGVPSFEVRHAATYRSPREFENKRVLIVGLGNSGADIACDAATVARETHVSIRRGYHFIPKYVFGVPADVFAHEGPSLPLWLEKRVFGLILRLLVGDTTKWGMPRPDHDLLDSHPLLNDQLLHHLRHGDVRLVGDVEGYDGSRVRLVDGRQLEVDLVLYATGYTRKISYLDERYLEGSWAAGNFLTCFVRNYPRLFTMGFAEVNSGLYPHLSRMARLVGWVIENQVRAPERAARFFEWAKQTDVDLTGGRKLIATSRHAHYCDEKALTKALSMALRRANKIERQLPPPPAQLPASASGS